MDSGLHLNAGRGMHVNRRVSHAGASTRQKITSRVDLQIQIQVPVAQLRIRYLRNLPMFPWGAIPRPAVLDSGSRGTIFGGFLGAGV